jgi:LysM repeat protein
MAAIGALTLAGSAGVGRHTVASGETLWGIATRNGVSVAELAQANGLDDPRHIVTGTTLVIPEPAAPAPAPAAPTAPAAPAPAPGEGSRTHHVRPGNTLWGLARRYGVPADAIASANGLTDPRALRAGSTITIPAGGTGAPAPAAPPVPAPVPPAAPPAPAPPVPAPAPVPPPAPPAPVTAAAAPPPPPPPPAAPALDPARLPARLRLAPERLALVPAFQWWATRYGLDPGLLMSLTWLESGWQNDVVSPAGAIGIGQLLPDTVHFLSTEVMHQSFDPADPESNIRMSARYLKWLLDQTGGDVPKALAAYYQGLRSVNHQGVLPESTVYATTVLTIADRYF